jgi:hypothetical protein
MVIVEVALPFAGGITEVGLKLTVTPEGTFEADKLTLLLKPLIDMTITVVLVDFPGFMVCVEGMMLTLKSVTVKE